MPSIKEILQQHRGQLVPGSEKTIPSHSEGDGPRQSTDYTGRGLSFLERKGKELYGAHFRLYEEDYPLLTRLLAYASGEEERAEELGLSLRKGILLTGPVGCGKTSLLTLLRLLFPSPSRYRIKSCREVGFEFHQEGFEVVGRYSKSTMGPLKPPGAFLFDDLGTEGSQQRYGNTCQIMGEILLSRYDQFVFWGVKTHLTTNLTSAEIEQVYGLRVRSRMREMCNLLSFGAGATDKRA